MLIQNKQKPRALFALGCLLGAIVFLLLFTAAPLNVTYDTWLRTGFVERDITQHYTGWLFFRESVLSFPFGMADNINYPYGSAVTFTDSIPLFAIFFRLLEGFLPDTFQYFGWYTLLCYMLQGGAAMLLLSLFCQNLLSLCSGTLLLICNPILIERSFRHTALAAHFLILFALYLYFKNKQQGFAFRAGYLVLLGLAITIHPYFIPMLFGILFADLVEHCLQTNDFCRSALFLGAGFVVVLGTGYCIGIFSVPASGDTLAGYGFFAMNLNTLWTPVSAGGLLWSGILPPQNQGLGTYEGFNYLGLAVLCAAPLCALYFCYKQKWQGVLAALKQRIGLCFVCGCLTLFALSTTWVANIRVLFSIPLPAALQSLCNTFRASGRMFWPVYYLIFLFVIVTIANLPFACRKAATSLGTLGEATNNNAAHIAENNRSADDNTSTSKQAHSGCTHTATAKWGSVLLCALLVVQIADLGGILQQKRQFFANPAPTFATEMTSDYWNEIANCYDHLYSLDDYLYCATDVALFAASHHLTTNDGFTARFDVHQHRDDVAAETARLMQGQFAADTFYITSDESKFAEIAGATEGKTHAIRLDWHWYLILPITEDLPTPTASEDLFVFPLMPVLIPDFSDDYFTDGLSNTRSDTFTLYLNNFTARYFGAATVLYDEAGNGYDIIEYNYNYAGRFIITLDIEDVSVLKGQYLTSDINANRPQKP